MSGLYKSLFGLDFVTEALVHFLCAVAQNLRDFFVRFIFPRIFSALRRHFFMS